MEDNEREQVGASGRRHVLLMCLCRQQASASSLLFSLPISATPLFRVSALLFPQPSSPWKHPCESSSFRYIPPGIPAVVSVTRYLSRACTFNKKSFHGRKPDCIAQLEFCALFAWKRKRISLLHSFFLFLIFKDIRDNINYSRRENPLP